MNSSRPTVCHVRFEAYHRLAGRPNVIVDGSPTDGTVLTVTHWPGYPPPPALAEDLSAQMAFRLLEQPELIPPGVELFSNNHFDQDGLVSILALAEPASARPRRRLLEDVARAGDFATFENRDAARVSMAIAAAARGEDPAAPALPEDYAELTAILYADLIERLPAWCDDPASVESLWAEEDATLTASNDAFDGGGVTIEEHPDVDLAVVRVTGGAPTAGGHRFGGNWATGLHPMAVFARTDRNVVATVRGRTYHVEQRYESWVQYRSRPVRARRDLVPLTERLNELEQSDVVWSATAVGALTPTLTSGDGDSSLDPATLIGLLIDHLAAAPAAWDPFRAGS